MKAKNKYIFFFLACFAIVQWSCKKNVLDKTIDEKITLAANDKSPFGAYVFRNLAQRSFPGNEIFNNTKKFDKWHNNFLLEDEERTGNIYFIVTPRLLTYNDEVLAMSDFVERGNTLFVAANYFDPYFLELFSLYQQNDLSILSSPTAYNLRQTKTSLTDTALFKPSSFSFFFYPLQRIIAPDSSKKFEVLGNNDFGHPGLLRISIGKGELIVMTNSQALSNYFLLTGDNYKYALGALSYLPPYNHAIYWDDFYRRNSDINSRPPEGQSMFSALLSIPQMRWAFWILIATTLLWFVTNLFRRQRVIALQKSNTNSSIEFTQTIARLYFNQKDNHNIALKMIAYFQDHVRSKYFMNFTGFNEEFAKTLAAKTGLAPQKTEALINSIYTVQHNGTTDDATLLTLNEQIQEVLNR